jgi:hypothetical protein
MRMARVGLVGMLVSLTLLVVKPVMAQAGTLLTKIGNVSVTANYTQWWYTSENPVLQGTAAASSVVDITIDDAANSVTTDANGNWSYSPTTLTNGDHSVTIASTTESYSFTLTIGSTVPADVSTGGTATDSGETLPVAGGAWPTVMLGVMGAGMLLSGGWYLARERRSV